MSKYQDEVGVLIAARNTAIDEMKRVEQAARATALREEQRAREAEQRTNKLADVQAEIHDRTLRRSGQHLEADLAQLRRSYNAQIAAAREAGDTMLADRMGVLQKIREAETREQFAQNGGPGGLDAALQRQREFSQALKRVGQVAAVAELGLAGVRSATALASGDMEAFRRAIEAIPVAGRFAQIGSELYEMATAERAATEAIERATAAMKRAQDERLAMLKRQADINAERERDILSMEREMQVLRAPREQRDELAARLRGVEQVEEAERRVAKFREDASAMSTDADHYRAEVERVRKELDAAVRESMFSPWRTPLGRLNDQERIRQKQVELKENQKLLDTKLEEARATKAQADEEERRVAAVRERVGIEDQDRAALQRLERQRAIEEADAQIQDMRLRSAGQTLDAELAAIRRKYDKQLDEAREANNVELADRLAMLKRMEEAEAGLAEIRRQKIADLKKHSEQINAELDNTRERLAAARSAAAGVSINVNRLDRDRFLTGARERGEAINREVRSRESKQVTLLERHAEQLKEAIKELSSIRQRLEQGGIIQVVSSGGFR